MKPTADLVQIAANGGSLDLRQGSKPTADLIQIAATIARSGGSLVINGSKPTADLVQIVAAGKGRVTVAFEA